MLRLLLVAAVGYLLGSIPTGLWLGKITRGIDVRETGSRRTGATNVQRSMGTRAAVLVILIDFGKGFLAVWLGARLGGSDYAGMLAGMTSVVGHVWPLFAGFRGGRGVATGAGALAALAPFSIVASFVFMAAAIALTRYVSLGSIVATLVAPIAAAALLGHVPESDAAVPLAIFGGALVLIKHAENLGRILRGNESRLGASRASPGQA